MLIKCHSNLSHLLGWQWGLRVILMEVTLVLMYDNITEKTSTTEQISFYPHVGAVDQPNTSIGVSNQWMTKSDFKTSSTLSCKKTHTVSWTLISHYKKNTLQACKDRLNACFPTIFSDIFYSSQAIWKHLWSKIQMTMQFAIQ